MGEPTERFTHFIPSGADEIASSMEQGTPVLAACGKVWVPSRDPDRFYLCPECLRAICEWWAA